MSVVVVTWASKRQGLLPILERQLGAADVEFACYPRGVWIAPLAEQIPVWRKEIEKFEDRSRIIFTDAFDVLFYGSAEELEAKIPEVVIAAERNCFPDQYLADRFPDTGTPWRFVNGGGVAGSPKGLMAWLDEMEKQPPWALNLFGQQYLNFLRCADSPLVPLDSKAELFYCMQKEAGELHFKDGRPYNSLTKTFPNFIHFNGNWPKEPFFCLQELGKYEKEVQLA